MEKKRAEKNKYFAEAAAVTLLKQQPGDFFITPAGKIRRQGIAEKIGRMYYGGIPKHECIEAAEAAIDAYKAGQTVKEIEKALAARLKEERAAGRLLED